MINVKNTLLMKKISYITVILIFGLFFFSTSCQRSEKPSESGPVVALVLKTLNNPFFIDMQRGAEDAAKQLGINLIVQAAEREVDVEKQMQIIENLIQRKVAAICVTPSGSKEIVPALVKANRTGIHVLIVDTRVDAATLTEAGGYIATFIGSDNVEGGRIAGKFIVDKLNSSGKIVILEGIPGHETGDARLIGFHQAVDSIPRIEIVASQTANWERDQGYNVFQNILQSHPGVQGLFACNDMMALGAVEAIAAAGKTGEIIVVGFDAIDDARIAIRQGTMNGSVAQHPYEMGKQAVVYAHRLIIGQKIPDYIPVQIELITRNNLVPDSSLGE
ncbi:MAG: substrate-binding domain-containing protein [Candidatus Marinimicrobia bacterium]|nr:substrate-binding domain-containing protein [Candidatus Neomarinimicrobiota bacterium]